MRTDLNVPYSEKDLAKSMGARWDGSRKIWYVENVEDLEKFWKWMPQRHTGGASAPGAGAPGSASKKPATAGRDGRARAGSGATTSKHVVHCGCFHILPWEHCEHSRVAAG